MQCFVIIVLIWRQVHLIVLHHVVLRVLHLLLLLLTVLHIVELLILVRRLPVKILSVILHISFEG